jgi:hypothetical protein
MLSRLKWRRSRRFCSRLSSHTLDAITLRAVSGNREVRRLLTLCKPDTGALIATLDSQRAVNISASRRRIEETLAKNGRNYPSRLKDALRANLNRSGITGVSLSLYGFHGKIHQRPVQKRSDRRERHYLAMSPDLRGHCARSWLKRYHPARRLYEIHTSTCGRAGKHP